jgi:hypothetical protein
MGSFEFLVSTPTATETENQSRLLAHQDAVDRGVVEGDVAAGALLSGVDLTGVKGPGVDVEADGALVPLARIEDGVDRLARIDGAGIGRIDFDEIGRHDFAGVLSEVLGDDSVILDHQLADGGGHPTVLISMIVDGADLAYVPTDGHQFEGLCFVDQIARVVLAVPEEIGSEAFGIDGVGTQDFADTLDVGKSGFGQGLQLVDELVDCNFARNGCLSHDLTPRISEASRSQACRQAADA